MMHLKHVSHRSKLQEKQRKQFERDMLALCEATKQKEILLHRCLNTFNGDSTCTTPPSTKADLLSLQCQNISILFQPATDKSAMHEIS